MGSGGSAGQEADRIRRAADAVLSDPHFVRSPVLSRLLAFLVEKSTSGAKVNAFTIAMDGLGRSSIELSEAETYARVAVARLRRTLGHVYAATPGIERLVIETGTYVVRLEACDRLAGPPQASDRQEQVAPAAPQSSRRWPARMQPVIAIGIAVILLIAAMLAWSDDGPGTQWSTPDLPKVAVTVAQGSLPPARAERYRQEQLGALSAYVGLIVIDRPSEAANFLLKIYPSQRGSAIDLLFVFEEARTGRIVWSGSKSMREEASHKAIVSSIAATIASPNGILHSHARRQGYEANSPYGCWLRFTESVQTYNTIGDDVLGACARKWYAAAPQRRLAAFLYGWTLTDMSITQLRAGQREETLQQAIKVLHQAQVHNPDFSVLHIAEMRAQSFRGDRQRAIAAAQQAIRTARNNRLVIGMAASGMATWNDPRGAQVLRELQSDPEVSFPWEHVGLFIAAMMADDLAEAGRQMDHLASFEEGQPLLVFLAAAHAGRSGDRAGAEAALKRLSGNPLTSFASPKRVIDRLPLAPEVRSTLRAWIGGSVGG